MDRSRYFLVIKKGVFLTGINPDASWQWLRQFNDAKQGDKEAMGVILQAFWQSLWNHASCNLDLTLQPKKAASDLIQDAFLDAQNLFSHFHGSTQEELRTRLLAILVNNMKDAWRRHGISQKREVSREIGKPKCCRYCPKCRYTHSL